MSGQRLNRRMSAEDAWFLYFEKPDAPLHIGSIAIYEGTVPFEKIHASMDARMHLIPRYRQRAVIPPFYAGHPTWEDDPEFSLDRHLRLITLPAPGTDEQLRAAASEIFAEMLPRDRSLWDITVIHGLEGGRTAYLSRVHHCLVDGVSGIELLLAVLDLVPNPEPTPPPAEPWAPKPLTNPLESWADAMFERWSDDIRAFTEWQQNLLDVRGQVRRMEALTRAMQVALPAALRPPMKMPWNKTVGAKRTAGFTQMSFQEVRGIRSALGGTVNDVMLSILGGALGRYLREHGEKTDGARVRLMIPVNVRGEGEKGALGNRVSMMLPNIPVDAMSPEQRLRSVREEMERLKGQSQASAFESLRQASENVPALFHALAGINGVPPGGANLVCTNVPGPMIPLFTVGHRMLAHYPMVPLAGDLGIGVGITSYNTSLYMGIMSDPAIVPDVERIAAYASEEFRALRDAAGVAVSDLPDIGAGARPTNGHAGNGNGAMGATHATPAPTPAPVTTPV
ncbi:MAG: wax ester/triacylglycerol synthase family O-acyltransferase [Chloroflexi bacterium]|nr:wax ester/triacylglycerol synthase family O-acyltransferase [Chloroflexota bacterium]